MKRSPALAALPIVLLAAIEAAAAELPATNDLIGLDVDLAAAIANKLGVTITWTDVPFDQLIPSLQTGRTDFVISGFSAVQGGETLPYVMSQDPGTFAGLGKPIATQYTGIATGVKQDGLQKARSGALDALIADGSSGKLLAKWQFDGMGVERATINAGQ